MKNPLSVAKISLLSVLCAITLSASAEVLDYGTGLEGYVTRTESNPGTQSKYITYYRVFNPSMHTVFFKITIRYADGTNHTWDWSLSPSRDFTFFLDTPVVTGVVASVYRID